jgi:hypothetical protein
MIAKKAIRFLIVLAMLGYVATGDVAAQAWPFELWHDGKIVLLEGDTLRGHVRYNLQTDLVEYAMNEEKPEAFTARKVLFFEIFDETVHKYRRFFALPFAMNAGYKAPVFFELLVEGKMTLLAREFLENKVYTSVYYAGSYSRVVLSYKYFFLKEDGDIVEFNGNKNDLLDLMGKQANDVEKYMKSNRLRVEDKYDFAKIVSYYNSLSGS